MNGLKWAFSSQPNFKIHFFFAFCALAGGIFFQVSSYEMLILILAVIFGFGVEMVNTSIEAMTDLITTEYKKQAKIAKDVSAGMMLIVAIGALIIAGVIFIPKIFIFAVKFIT